MSLPFLSAMLRRRLLPGGMEMGVVRRGSAQGVSALAGPRMHVRRVQSPRAHNISFHPYLPTHRDERTLLRCVTNQVARNLPGPWGELGSGTQLSQRPTAALATLLPRHAARWLRTWPTDALAKRLHATCHHDAWPTANTSNTVGCSTPRSGVQRGQLLRDQHGCTYKPRS
jgi:hypothetical protein